MQPKTKQKINKETFEILKKTIHNIHIDGNEIKIPELPEFIAVRLTNRCNMCCKHCYEWNEEGYYNLLDENSQKDIINIDIIENLLKETRDIRSRFYLWGGEPLLHPEFSKIAELFIEDPREVAICTNGTLIENNLKALIKLGSTCKLELLIAIEGFEKQHDSIRGEGTYQRMFQQLEHILKLRKQGIFKGKISVHTVINDNNVNNLFELLSYYEELQIDYVLLCYPWYISEDTSKDMTNYFNNNLKPLLNCNSEELYSWDSFKFRLSEEKITDLRRQLKMINEKTWSNCVRYQPDLAEKDLINFINGKDLAVSSANRCMSIFSRTDIFANGDVSVCKHFNEFVIGNLEKSSLKEIWNSEQYEKIREILRKKRMPVCSKCSALYLHNLKN